MGAFWQHDRILTRALLASLVLHLIFAYFIPAITTYAAAGPAVETISFVKMIRISLHKEQPQHVQAATAPRLAPRPVIEKQRTVAAGKQFTPSKATRSTANAAPQIAAQTAPGAAPAANVANASATASQSQPNVTAVTESRRNYGANMPLGADDPMPILDPGMHQQLAALGVHVTLTITVDENGHTKTVLFAPPLANDVEDHIRTMLASASWEPAYCGGGIACEGKAVITI